MAQVGIIVGSKSDEPYIQQAIGILEKMGIEFEVSVMSAHRNPEKVRVYGRQAEERGFEVLIAGAGYAAHLPGVLASWTRLPVIGVPLPTSDLKGVDSLLAIVQMPGGVPVAGMGIGNAGMKNAALFAAQILSNKYDKIKAAYIAYRENLSKD
jgi:5-(carboxyamino)imidazole ribonucleotide mutase